VKIVDYDATRRSDVAELMGRVWGEPGDERELEWFYERNPVAPASVLLAEEDGQVVATVAMSFVRMSIGGEELTVGMPVRLATDPAYQRRGIFQQLEAENEARAQAAGVRLLLIVPNRASAPVLLNQLGWAALKSLRVWGRMRPFRPGGRRLGVDRFSVQAVRPATGDRVIRDTAWLNWRFADALKPYTLLEGDGYAVAGRRGKLGVVAAVEGRMLRALGAAAPEAGLIAAPPPRDFRHYLLAGYLPTMRTFTVLGKSLDPAQAVPARPHFELGDLDFF
jgi:GNAT superfamily N-acetyltransferase